MTSLLALILLASASRPRPHPVWTYKDYDDMIAAAPQFPGSDGDEH